MWHGIGYVLSFFKKRAAVLVLPFLDQKGAADGIAFDSGELLFLQSVQ